MGTRGAHWYFTKEELNRPVRPGGLDPAIANKYRRATCIFIQKAGIALRLPQFTIATAMVYFHRFFARKDFEDYDRYTIAMAALFLAGKVEETPKKLRDVITECYKIRHKNAEISPEEMNTLREEVLVAERVLLQTLAFDLTVEHPYKYLLQYVKTIEGDRELAQTAWNFVNDSLRTTLCLQFRPPLIASAAIYLASKFLRVQLTKSGEKPWWEIFDAKIQDLEEISNQILDLYQKSQTTEAIKQGCNLSQSTQTSPLTLQSPDSTTDTLGSPRGGSSLGTLGNENNRATLLSSTTPTKMGPSPSSSLSSVSPQQPLPRESPPLPPPPPPAIPPPPPPPLPPPQPPPPPSEPPPPPPSEPPPPPPSEPPPLPPPPPREPPPSLRESPSSSPRRRRSSHSPSPRPRSDRDRDRYREGDRDRTREYYREREFRDRDYHHYHHHHQQHYSQSSMTHHRSLRHNLDKDREKDRDRDRDRNRDRDRDRDRERK